MKFNSLCSTSESVVSDDIICAESACYCVLEAQSGLQQPIAAILWRAQHIRHQLRITRPTGSPDFSPLIADVAA